MDTPSAEEAPTQCTSTEVDAGDETETNDDTADKLKEALSKELFHDLAIMNDFSEAALIVLAFKYREMGIDVDADQVLHQLSNLYGFSPTVMAKNSELPKSRPDGPGFRLSRLGSTVESSWQMTPLLHGSKSTDDKTDSLEQYCDASSTTADQSDL